MFLKCAKEIILGDLVTWIMKNTVATANFYYRNYGSIPFDMRVSAGEYLAGDVGYNSRVV